jgi:nucleoside-diphosphate-sugar epimerase
MSKQLVLITGASGHLGFKVLITALEAGYKTRVALRRLEQADKIKSAKSIQPHLDSVEFVEVPNITAEDAYDEAVKSVDLIIHCASPLFPDPTGVGASLRSQNINCGWVPDVSRRLTGRRYTTSQHSKAR